jgi:DNA-binding Lrp family transcriptional regulator
MRLDAIDLEILRILQKDSRIPYSEVASSLHISRPTVKARIERLKNQGIIRKFTIVIDRDAIIQNIIVLMQMRAENLEETAKALSEMSAVLEVYEVMGGRNLTCKAIVQSMGELKTLMGKINSLQVRDLRASVVLKTLKEEYETVIGPEIGVNLECEYCGKSIFAFPYKFKHHNVEHYFCCPICLKSYRKKIRT